MQAVPIVNWQAIGALTGFIVVWSGLLLWAAKHMLGRLEAKVDERAGQWREVDRQLQELRVELPQRYVQREDWIRFGATIDYKIDRIYEHLEELKRLSYGRRESRPRAE